MEFDFLSMTCYYVEMKESAFINHWIARLHCAGNAFQSRYVMLRRKAVHNVPACWTFVLTVLERSLPHSTAIKASPKLLRGSGCGWLKGSFVVLFKYAPCPRTAWYSWSRKGLYTTLRADKGHENVYQSSQKLGEFLKDNRSYSP